ncbi:MAG: hypothetical protein M3065_16620 [Actinomycetota bacterium]|nr:hypothetical protein [Actinomycetota bacterium]
MPYAEGPRRVSEGSGERPTSQPPTRRTVTIRGQVADRRSPRMIEVDRRRPARRPRDRVMSRPDRVALWAVLLCLLLVVAAATSAHAAVRLHSAHARHAAAPVASRLR